MAVVEIPFAGGAYSMPQTQLDAQVCKNWYVTVDENGKYPRSLSPRPGLSLYIDSSEHATRGQLSLNDVLYYVADNALFAAYDDQTREYLGTILTDNGPVKIITNDFQLLICDGEYGYIYQIITTDIYDAGQFFVITNASSEIGSPIFTGTGINDLTAFGKYLGDSSTTYKIIIDGIGSPNTFKWSDNGGASFTTGVTITGGEQKLSNGVRISFVNATGHTLNDEWDVSVTIGSSFYPPIYPAYQDGYGVYPQQDSNRVYISAINDFNSVDPLDYQAANIYPDNNVAAISVNQEVYIIKQETIEVWNDVGAITEISFPFRPRSNFVINYGCEAPFTVKAGSANIIFMLARNKNGSRMVVMIENYSAKVISTEPLNAELRSYEVVDDAFADIIEINNHIFYYITFPTADKTWVYDLTTNMWSEWTSYETPVAPLNNPHFGRFRGMFHCVFAGLNIVGDSITGKLFQLDSNSFLDYTTPIAFERTSPHFSVENKWVTINRLMIDMERGVALPYGQGSQPVISLQVSRDGGRTWGSELWRTSGSMGQYAHRALWDMLGTARQFTFRVRCTDPVFNVILGVIADIEVME